MARPIKIGLDYFPLDVNIDDDIELIEAEHGLSGFAIIIKLWQKIYSNGYYIKWNNDVALLFSRKINSEITLINSVVNSCFKRNLFDEKLNKKYNILTSSGIQKRFINVSSHAKRKTISLIKEYTLVNSEFTSLITEFTSLNVDKSTQSKVKESKVKESTYNEFYDLEIENSNKDSNYIKFVQILFGNNNSELKLTGILKLKNQLSYKQFGLIYNEKKKNDISLTSILENLENRPDLLKRYSTLQRVLLNWMKPNNK